jgi:hypothetical protein
MVMLLETIISSKVQCVMFLNSKNKQEKLESRTESELRIAPRKRKA